MKCTDCRFSKFNAQGTLGSCGLNLPPAMEQVRLRLDVLASDGCDLGQPKEAKPEPAEATKDFPRPQGGWLFDDAMLARGRPLTYAEIRAQERERIAKMADQMAARYRGYCYWTSAGLMENFAATLRAEK